MEPGVKRASLKYIEHKVKDIIFKTFNREAPWWNPEAVRIAGMLIRETDVILEYGSGRSTLWLAKRGRTVLSVEHDLAWYNRVVKDIGDQNLSDKILLRHKKLNPAQPPEEQPYISFFEDKRPCEFDIILIDGKLRGHSVLFSIEFLNNNGILIIDDVHRYLPDRRGLSKIIDKDNMLPEWRKVWEKIECWREIRTGVGYNDTSFFFKG